jgi:hypothetical protein
MGGESPEDGRVEDEPPDPDPDGLDVWVAIHMPSVALAARAKLEGSGGGRSASLYSQSLRVLRRRGMVSSRTLVYQKTSWETTLWC